MAYDDSGRPNRTYGNHGPGAELNTIHIVGIVVGFFLIFNRLYWRWYKGTPGIDDIIIVLAWLALVALGVVTYLAVNYGYGTNSKHLTRDEASDALRMFYLYQIFYKLSLNLSKLSILTLYLRVFDTRDWFGRVTKALMFLVVTFTFSIIVANILVCLPVRAYWDTSPLDSPSHVHGTCVDVLSYWYASSLYNILSETLMLLSVLVRIWTLPSHSQPPILQFRQKINLTIVLGLGLFTLITAILRVTTLDSAAQQVDKTGGTLISTVWSSVEVTLGLAVANLPMMRQLLRWRGWFGGRWFGSTADKSRHGSNARRRSEYTPAPMFSDTTSPNPSRTRDPLGRDASRTQIHLTRDFQREVITSRDRDGSRHDNGHEMSTSDSASGNDSTLDDVESQTISGSDLSSRHPSKSFHHHQVEFSQPQHHPHSPPLGCHSSTKSFKGASNILSTEIRGGSGGGGSNTPSIASTLNARSPTEPISMVRINTEPSVNSLQSTLMQPTGMVQAHVKGI